MSGIKYTKDHEWVMMDGDVAVIGITDYAKEALGDLVYLELPDEGKEIEKGRDFAVVESVKAASEIYAPVSGEITEVNAQLVDMLDDLGSDPEKGWIVKMNLSNKSELEMLMDEEAYQTYIKDL
ncbi:MAG: glycine cleavage system protein H [Micavibrio sp.]|nr:glycine cleavage system protein H [Micavibrio sp.]